MRPLNPQSERYPIIERGEKKEKVLGKPSQLLGQRFTHIIACRMPVVVVSISNECYALSDKFFTMDNSRAYTSWIKVGVKCLCIFVSPPTMIYPWQRLLLFFVSLITYIWAQDIPDAEAVKDFFHKDGVQGHTNNWAVLVCASRYWFNYRVIYTFQNCKKIFLTKSDSIWPIHWACKQPSSDHFSPIRNSCAPGTEL